MNADNRDVSIEALEGKAWLPAPAAATSLMRKVHKLRTVPIGDPDIEDLRVLLSHGWASTSALRSCLVGSPRTRLPRGTSTPLTCWWPCSGSTGSSPIGQPRGLASARSSAGSTVTRSTIRRARTSPC